jgi:uncharacterized lipoprotein
MRRSIVAAALLLLTVAGCGSGSTGADAQQAESTEKTDKAASSTTTVGKPLTVKVQSGATAEVTVLKVTTAKKGKGEFAEKPANGQFVVVDVQIKVTGKQFSVNPLYLKYQAADDKVFDSSEGNAFGAGFEPALQSGDVPEGQSSRGYVVFDTPAGTGKQVQLTDELGSPIAFWTL